MPAPRIAPFVVQPAGARDVDALLTLIAARGADLVAALERAPVLLRGFVIAGPADFARVVGALSAGRLQPYRGGASPRRPLGAGPQPVYNSTDYPPHLDLPLHNELSYSASYPDRIFFCCLDPPAQGGATTIGDSRCILAAMPDAIRAAFAARGVQYVRLLGPEKGSGFAWQDAFASDDRHAVEAHCASTGATCEWLPGDMVRVIEQRPAIIRHPVTGEELWFNQVAGFHPRALDAASRAELIALRGDESRFRLNVRFGDGGAIDDATIDAILAVLRAQASPHYWQQGDLLMLDNMLFAHGRAPFSGRRSIAVAMS